MKQITLSNGIRCLLHETKYHHSVTVTIMFKVGSRDEPVNYYGLTHFAEHMFFKGTEKRPEARMISAEVDQYGGLLNAVTDYDITAYYIKINYQKLEVALDVLSDLLFNALFRQKDINSEKHVIISELKRAYSSPSRFLNLMMGELIYTGTTLGHDVGGDMAKIKKATREQFLHYVSHFYRPENTVVSIVGNFPMSEKKLTTLVKKYFNHHFNYSEQIPKGIKLTPKKFSPRKLYQNFQEKQKRKRFRSKVMNGSSHSYLMIGFPSWKYDSRDYYQSLVLGAVLGKGMSSRLFIAVREKHSLSYSIKTEIEAYQDLGIFAVVCDTNNPQKAYQVIWEELEKIKQGELSHDEVNKAKEYLIGEEVLQRENTNYLSWMYAYDLVNLGKVLSYRDYQNKVKKVKLSEVIEMAHTLFKKSKENVCVISPKKMNKNMF